MPVTLSSADAVREQLLSLAQRFPARPIVLAIDGRCGSGKSTLGAALSAALPDSVLLHTDDFYLPFPQRVSGWEKIPAANMDFARLREEVLLPLCAGKTAAYRAWSCPQSCFLPTQPLTPQRFVILEGSYSHHPSLRDLYDLRLFVTCSPAVQRSRLQKREGAHFAAFESRWIPLEEGYFTQYAVAQTADLLWDTTSVSV